MRTSKTRTALAIAAATLSLGALAAPALAQPVDPPIIPGWCAIEEDGQIFYVQAGTSAGGLVCGADGNWHMPTKSASAASLSPQTATPPATPPKPSPAVKKAPARGSLGPA